MMDQFDPAVANLELGLRQEKIQNSRRVRIVTWQR
jgi:hypothetical protein